MASPLFVEGGGPLLAVTPTAHWLEYLDVAGAILAEPCQLAEGRVTARGPGLGLAWDEKAVERFKLWTSRARAGSPRCGRAGFRRPLRPESSRFAPRRGRSSLWPRSRSSCCRPTIAADGSSRSCPCQNRCRSSRARPTA